MTNTEQKIKMEQENRPRYDRIIEFLGMSGLNKCNDFSNVDGPDAKYINAIFEAAKENNQDSEYISVFENAYKILDESLPILQNEINTEVDMKFGMENNEFNAYKLLLELTQSLLPKCEAILITNIVTTEKKGLSTKGFSKKAIIERVEYLGFHKDGTILPSCNLKFPLATTLDHLVAQANAYNEKLLENSTNKIEFNENTLNMIEFVGTKSDVKDDKNLNTTIAFNKQNVNKNSGDYITVRKKNIVIGLSLLAALSVGPVYKHFSEYNANKEIVKFLEENPSAKNLLDERQDIDSALKVYGLAYDKTSKSIVPDDAENGTQSASNN